MTDYTLLTLVLRVREGTGEALGFLLLLAVFATVLTSMSLIKVWTRTAGRRTHEMKAKLALITIRIVFWIICFSLPDLR